MWEDYLWVALIGVLLGAAELSSRYRDAPLRALVTPAALTYIGLNLLASIICLYLIQAVDLDFKVEDPYKARVTQILVSGFGAMAFFRSSFFVFRVGNQDVSVGPASVLQILLSALDSSVDRVRAEQRAGRVQRIMEGISFSSAKDPLPTIAIALMRNLPREDQDRMRNQVRLLMDPGGPQLPERTKTVALGLAILDVVGEKVLTAAVELVRSDVQANPLLDAASRFLASMPDPPKPVHPDTPSPESSAGGATVPPASGSPPVVSEAPPPNSLASEATTPPVPPGNLPVVAEATSAALQPTQPLLEAPPLESPAGEPTVPPIPPGSVPLVAEEIKPPAKGGDKPPFPPGASGV